MTTDDVVKLALSQWAEKEKLPETKAIIQNIEVKSKSSKNLAFLKMDTLKESRILYQGKERVKSYEVSKINAAYNGFTPENFDVWHQTLNSYDTFKSVTNDYRMEGSAQANICHTCKGEGHETCHSCGGRGSVTCGSCGGDGEVSCGSCRGSGYCSSCGGSGYHTRSEQRVNEYTDSDGTFHREIYYVDVKDNCYSCGGSGRCDCGNGLVTCSRCNGHGDLTCSSCGGSGRVTCSTCNGQGGLSYFYYTRQDFIATQKIIQPEHAHYLDTLGDLSSLIERSLTDHYVVFEKTIHENFSAHEVFEDCSKHFVDIEIDLSKLKTEIEACFSTGESQINTKIKATYYLKPMVELNYTYEGQSYFMIIDPSTLICHYKTNPLDDYLKNALADVQNNIVKKENTKAYHQLLTLSQVETSNSLDTVKETMDKLKSKMLLSYKRLGLLSYILVAIQNVGIPFIRTNPFASIYTIVAYALAIYGGVLLSKKVPVLFEFSTKFFEWKNISHRFAYELSAVVLFGLTSFLIGSIWSRIYWFVYMLRY